MFNSIISLLELCLDTKSDKEKQIYIEICLNILKDAKARQTLAWKIWKRWPSKKLKIEKKETLF